MAFSVCGFLFPHQIIFFLPSPGFVFELRIHVDSSAGFNSCLSACQPIVGPGSLRLFFPPLNGLTFCSTFLHGCVKRTAAHQRQILSSNRRAHWLLQRKTEGYGSISNLSAATLPCGSSLHLVQYCVNLNSKLLSDYTSLLCNLLPWCSSVTDSSLLNAGHAVVSPD